MLTQQNTPPDNADTLGSILKEKKLGYQELKEELNTRATEIRCVCHETLSMVSQQSPCLGAFSKQMKFPADARGGFACCMVKQADGKLIGKKNVPFDYTGRKVLGKESYDSLIKAELRRAKTLVSGKWRAVRGGGYEALRIRGDFL